MRAAAAAGPMGCKLLIITVGLSGECVVGVDALAMTATTRFVSFSEQLYYDM